MKPTVETLCSAKIAAFLAHHALSEVKIWVAELNLPYQEFYQELLKEKSNP